MSDCGCDVAEIAEQATRIEDEIQVAVNAYVSTIVNSKDGQIEVIREMMKQHIKELKKKPWCVVCLREAKTYVSDCYFCSKDCVQKHLSLETNDHDSDG